MSKIVSIDYGHKRVGLAVTDDEKIIATGLATIKSKDIFSFLEKYVNDNKIECFVVGEPLNLNGNHSESNKCVKSNSSKAHRCLRLQAKRSEPLNST